VTCVSRSHSLGACVAALVMAAPIAAYAQQPAPTLQAAAPAPPPAAQVQPAPRAPVPNRLNDVLPAWLRVRGEFRERMEGFDGFAFTDGRDDLYWLSRLRLNTTVTPSKSLSFQVQAQDARVGRKTVGPTGAPFKAPFDLRMAFADIGAASSPFTVRVGRQELVYGEQRLVGHVGWLNAARTFDAAKVTYRHAAFSVDAFGASVVRTLVDEFDRSGAGNRFAGIYGTTTKLLPQATVEPYVFYKRDVNLRNELAVVDDLQHATVGVRVAGRLPARLDYGVEMAVQRGSLGAEDVRAWAGHWQLRGSLPGPGAIKLTGEYNFASGDDSPADGVRGTFDQLYPTPHDKTGLADQVGWKNVRHVRAGIEFTPLTGLPVTTNYHSWWLAETRDAAYTVGNAVIGRVPTGAADSHVGQEIDVQVTRALTPQLALAAGYAHIAPGAFLAQVTPGASYSHPYVMVTYVFFAER
jgi:hypothetical protein